MSVISDHKLSAALVLIYIVIVGGASTFPTIGSQQTPGIITCPPKQFVNIITASSDQCGFAEAQLIETGNLTMLVAATIVNATIVTFPTPFPVSPNVTVSFAFTLDSNAEYHIDTQQNIITATNSTAADTWVAMPNALTELFGSTSYRQWIGGTPAFGSCAAGTQGTCGIQSIGLSGFVKAAGSANAKLRIQYNNSTSPNITTGWVDPCNGAADMSIASTGLQFGPVCSGCSTCMVPWQASQVRIVGVGGNGIASPQFGSIIINIDQVVARFSEVMICNTAAPIACPNNGNFSQMPNGGITSTQFAVEVYTFPTAPTKSVGALTFVIEWQASECILANLSAC